MNQKRYERRYVQPPLNTCLVRVAKTAGIDRHSIEDDVEYILYHFISRPNQTFKDFDDLWNELHFNFVHFACVKREFRAIFMDAFFASFLFHFSSPLVSVKCAVLFSIYFLYMTQPSVWGKNRIRVTKELFSQLFDFYVESIQSEENIEAALIFDKLRTMEAFLFVGEQEQDPFQVQERIEFSKVIAMNESLHDLKKKKINNDVLNLCSESHLKEFKNLAKEYDAAKKELYYTPQATLATQKMLKETLNVKETRRRLLQNVLLANTFAKDETEAMKRIIGSGQQMLNSKRRKLERKKLQ
ncbi:small nuclear RNA activating complex, subunit SNAP43-domain-containing protein [Cokeromyces recurvatus]|uniref:small nuclear RNA activating complex, subunit SNAP43-domain-containing protein n=1 Tax=Cokeromyces recurvatus TaxID=90255 RepID=UPI0022205421|nr:small nuclear RNA activating complex, subunit SNAP43-domain-containing protein [Cokeromyces recurvatus]KAI7904069.1 small nuclear RNA activating complex, subunit SNAP43-domain-containing protein [Cokeromyces recurvatus]